MNTQHKLKDLPAILYKYLKLLALISGFVALGLVLYFIIFVSKGFYHADCADTILWAQATVDGKAIMNPDFYYAAILPFGGQLIMVPFVAIFGYGMLAQIIGASSVRIEFVRFITVVTPSFLDTLRIDELRKCLPKGSFLASC